MGYKLEIEKLEHPLLKPLLEDFSIIKGSAVLLGIDIHQLLIHHKTTKDELKQLIKTELNKNLESWLLNQIIETNSISLDEVEAAMKLFYTKLN